MTSHVILGAKTGKPPFYFKDGGNVCGRRFSWQFYRRTRKQRHITKNTTRCKTFANLFRNQKWAQKSWRNSSNGVKRIHLQVCRNQRNLSTYEINTLQRGKCSVRIFFTRCFVSENSLVRFMVLLSSWIKIVRAHFPWSNLYIHYIIYIHYLYIQLSTLFSRNAHW